MRRRFHTDTRLSENFTEKGLESLTGQQPREWVRYICKELIDNSLEECKRPEIIIRLKCDDDGIEQISIRDNGPGIEEDIMHQIFRDIEHFGGSKRHYMLPTRGKQGNALMTVLGIQYLRSKPLTVVSNDIKYTINALRNELEDKYEIKIEKEKVENINGLEVQVQDMPDRGSPGEGLEQVYEVFYNFVDLNPQAKFTLISQQDPGHRELVSGEPHIYEAPPMEGGSVKSLSLNSKSTTTGKVIWFTEDDFSERLKADYRVEPELSVRDLIGEFYGLASSRKRKAVLDNVGLNGEVKTISNLFNEKSIKESTVSDLYHGMKQETDPFSDRGIKNTLGSIGEEGMNHGLMNVLKLRPVNVNNEDSELLFEAVQHTAKRIQDNGGDIDFEELFVYYADGGVKEAEDKTVPFYFEMIAVPSDWRKKGYWGKNISLTFGINQSFLYSTPDVPLSIDVGGRQETYRGFEAAFLDTDYNFTVVCNLTCPNAHYQDKGKQKFNAKFFKSVFEEVLGKTLRKLKRDVIPVLNKLNEDPEPERQEPELSGKAPKGFIKGFVFDNFIAVYNEATEDGQYTLTQRQFFYAMRPLFLKRAEELGYKHHWQASRKDPKELKFEYGTFCGYVDEYEKNELGERIIYKKERGFFVEPHSDRRINLGTSSVEKYHPDLDQYGSLLFVEKTGFYELLHNDFELSKKYDIGLINAEGYSTNAARDLVEKIQKADPDVKLYTLTDFDIKGLGIARNAMEADELSAVDIFDCERLGLTLEDLESYNLPVEPANYEKSVMTELENAYKEGHVAEAGYKFLKQDQRVEINAFKPIELRDYLLAKFEEHGIQKLKPEDESEVETFEVEDVETIKKRAVREAVGEHVNSELRGKLMKFLEGRLQLDEPGEKAKKELNELTDNQEHTLFETILGRLEDLPPKNWKKINEELVKKKEAETEQTKREYRDKVKKEVLRQLEKNVDIGLDISTDR